MSISKFKHFLTDLLFPRFCFGCGKEGIWLCHDCFSVLEIQNYAFCPFHQYPKRVLDFKICKNCRKKTNLIGLFYAVSYQNLLIKHLIQQFKYPPFIKELADPLSYLITSHLSLTEFKVPEQNSLLLPIPLDKQRKKWRGFNQAEELTKLLSKFFKIPFFNNILIKKNPTLPQTELKEKDRQKNISGAFLCQNQKLIKNKKIFLVDDVYTSGFTMEECAKVLKQNGAKEIWGIVIARG